MLFTSHYDWCHDGYGTDKVEAYLIANHKVREPLISLDLLNCEIVASHHRKSTQLIHP